MNHEKTKAAWIALALSIAMSGPQLSVTAAYAAETVQQKAQDQADQANVQAKKKKRKMNQEARNAADKKNILKDAGDNAANATDQASGAIKKEERKSG